MAYSSSETNVKRLMEPSLISLFRRLSLRSIKGIAVGFLLGTVLGFLLLWQPAYFHLRSLEKERTYWQQVLRTGVPNFKTTIPTMDQLPDIIEQCRSAFVKGSVDVVTLNVERFGERRESGNGENLDYSLVRVRLRGKWEGIITSLKVLEEKQEVSIRVQEAVLDADGGEVLLQVYFCATK